jgi:DNA-binding IclR family transcriptional regulator
LSIYNPLSEFRREANATSNKLKDRVGHTVGFVLFLENERILLDISYGRNSLTVAHDTWLKSPIHASASGKLQILAKGEGMRRYIESLELKPYTTATICDPKRLENDLLESYRRGFVVVRDEHIKGLTAIGAPVWNLVGACIGCLFLNARSSDISAEQISELGELLRNESELFTLSTSSAEPVSHMFNTHEPTSFNRSSYVSHPGR